MVVPQGERAARSHTVPSPCSRRACLRGLAGGAGAAALAAACGPMGGDKIARGKSDREVTIRWSTWGDDKNSFNTEAAPQGVKLFGQSFPKIKIAIEPQLADWQIKNQTEWVAGTGPDVSGHCCYWGTQFARDGLLWNMEPAMKKDVPARIRDDYVEWLMKLFFTPEQGQFALPMYSGTIALFFNKTVFQRKGVPFPDDTWDWNKYREAAIKLNEAKVQLNKSEAQAPEPQHVAFGRKQVRGYDRILQRLHQSGGHYVDPKDDRRAALDAPETLRALQYERDANLKDKYTGHEDDFIALKGLDYFKALSAQRYAMWEEGSFALVRLYRQVEKDVVPQWDIAPLPKGPAQRGTLATNDGWSIWKGSKYVEEAWEFVKFLQGDEWTDINTRATGQQPARKSFQEHWAKTIKEAHPPLADKNFKPFTDAIQQNYARPVELFRRHRDSLKIVDQLLNEAVYAAETGSAIKNGEKALDSAVADAVRRINELNR
jgi:multiple sugar transport system substrate-binding protein